MKKMNRNKKMLNYNQKQRFGYRKLSAGLASVCLGMMLFTTEQTVSAQTISQNTNQTQSDAKAKLSSTSLDKKVSTDQKSVNSELVANETKKQDEVKTSPNIKKIQTDSHKTESKKEQAQHSKTSAKKDISADQPIKMTSNLSGSQGQKMAGRDALSLSLNITSPQITLEPNQKINVTIGNNESNSIVKVENWDPNTTKTLEKGQFEATNLGNGNFAIGLINQTETLSGKLDVQLSIDLSADRDKVASLSHDDQPVSVNIPITATYKNQTVETTPITVDYVPYKDEIREDEIADGFIIGLKNIGSEKQYSEIVKDLPKNASDNDPLMQYGVYFNYGKGKTGLDPLMNAIYDQSFSEGQRLLPHSIKVFEVPSDLISKPNSNNRISIDDDLGNGQKVYSKITANGQERPEFEKFLQDHLYVSTSGQEYTLGQYMSEVEKGNFPKINKIYFKQDGEFKINKDTSYGKHAYFFQMDTLLDKKFIPEFTKPGKGPSIITTYPGQIVDGKAQTLTQTSKDFQGDGSGYFKVIEVADKVVFADVTNKRKVEKIDGQVNSKKANSVYEKVTFPTNRVEDIISILGKENYTLVGISDGDKTSGKYDGSSYYSISDPDESKNLENYRTFITHKGYGNYTWTEKAFTLNFVKDYKLTETKSVSENVKFIYKNGPKKDQEVSAAVNHTTEFSHTRIDGNWSEWKGNELPTVTILVSNPYKVDLSNITVNDKKLPVENVTVENNQIKVTIDPQKVADKTQYNIVVPYVLAENITVKYIDDDTNKVLETKKLTGEPQADANYSTKDTIAKYEKENYKLVSDQTNGKELYFDNDEDPDNQNYEVHFKHRKQLVTQEKAINETIKYVYANGPKKNQEAAPTYKATPIKFVGTAIKDLVTGKTGSFTWSPAQAEFKEVVSPVITNYKADKEKIDKQTVNLSTKDLNFVVYYTMEFVPGDNHNTPNEPKHPENNIPKPQPAVPEEPENNIPTPYPSIPKEPENNYPKPHSSHTEEPTPSEFDEDYETVKPHSSKVENNVIISKASHKVDKLNASKQTTLPQTGERKSNLSLIGLAFMGLASVLGFSLFDKKERN